VANPIFLRSIVPHVPVGAALVSRAYLVEGAKVAFDVVEYRGKQAAENLRAK
jgi:hypothetical protein